MADPTDRDPANFPGNPYPPAKVPDTSGIKTPSAPADASSAGTGALPPAAAADGPPSAAAAPGDVFRVYTEPDGKHSVFQIRADGTGERAGSALADDTQKILDTVGTFNESTKSWDVPPEAAKALLAGKLPLPDYIKAKWAGGEQGAVRGMVGQKFLAGEFSAEDAISRGNPELLSSQLKDAPIFAFHGGYGDTVKQMWKDAKAAGVGGIARRAAGEIAGAAPELLNLGGEAAKDAAIIGGGTALMALAAGTTGPAAPAVIAMAGGAVGLNYGLFKHTMDNSAGNTALDMLDKGYDPATVKTMAPLAGAINGALMIGQFKYMTAGMQRSFVGKVLASDSVKGMLARYVVDAGKGVTLATAQTAVNIALNNVAAIADNKPGGLNQQPIEDLINAAVTAAPVMAAMGLVGAALERPTSEGAGADPASAARGQETRPGEGQRTAEGAASASASGNPEGTIGPASQTSSEPLDTSVTEHPTFVKAAETAKPYLPAGVEPTDRVGVTQAYNDIVTEHHDFINEITPLLGRDELGVEKLTPERKQALSDKMQAQAEKMAGLSRLAKIVHDPEKAIPYFENADKPESANTLPPPEDPHTVARAVVEARAANEAKPIPEAERKYVTNRPLNVDEKGSDKATAKNARDEYAGAKNEQLVRGNQLADELRRDVPDPVDRQGMFWYKAAEGDKAVLQDALQDPDLEKYHPQIERALSLPDHAVAALDKVDRYYKEAGDVASEIGTIRNVLENYQNRLYMKDDGEPARTEASATGLKQTTRHAKQRIFDTEFDAARAGKTFATTDVADALALHNGEMARVNTARKLADTMSEAGIGAWHREGNVPEGWTQVGELSKDIPLKGRDGKALIGEDGNQVHARSVFTAPEGIAKGLRALVDPDWTKKMDVLKDVQSAQGAVKTGFLSWSFFHHLSFVSQLVYRGDFSSLMQLKNMDEALAHPGFLENEKDFALHGGMTSQVEANADIERALAKAVEGDESVVGKVKGAPVVKQVLEQTDKNANFLFGKMQRLWKVNTYAAMRANWIADNLGATNEQVTAANRGFAASTNDIFGGQNWEAMGMTKSNLSLLRLAILAPDWTASNISLLKHAVGIGENAAENSASRAHLIKALAVGVIGTELMNKILTGHTTDKNAPGHKLEVEIAPNVYVSMIRGGPQDILKLGSMVTESGAAGADRFAAGKLSPAARMAIGLASNTQYTGKPIVPKNSGPMAGTYDVLKYIFTNASPVPLGISNLWQYADEKHKTALGAAAVGSGVGRYSKPPKDK